MSRQVEEATAVFIYEMYKPKSRLNARAVKYTYLLQQMPGLVRRNQEARPSFGEAEQRRGWC